MALFRPEFGLVFWMLVIFLVVLGILARYAWPVIIRSIEARAEFIDSGVKYTEEAMQKLAEVREKADALLADAHRQQLAILQETERMKQGLIEEARKAAQVEAQKVMESAQVAVEQMQREAEVQMRRQVSLLSLEIAEKVLRKNLSDDAAQEELVERLLDELEQKS